MVWLVWGTVFAVFALFVAVVIRQLLTGAINTRGLVTGRRGAPLSFARLQLLLTTAFMALVALIEMPRGGAGLDGHGPLAELLVIAFGGSNLGLLAYKTWFPTRQP